MYKTENIRIEMAHEGPCLPEPEFFAPATPDVIETTTEASEVCSFRNTFAELVLFDSDSDGRGLSALSSHRTKSRNLR